MRICVTYTVHKPYHILCGCIGCILLVTYVTCIMYIWQEVTVHYIRYTVTHEHANQGTRYTQHTMVYVDTVYIYSTSQLLLQFCAHASIDPINQSQWNIISMCIINTRASSYPHHLIVSICCLSNGVMSFKRISFQSAYVGYIQPKVGYPSIYTYINGVYNLGILFCVCVRIVPLRMYTVYGTYRVVHRVHTGSVYSLVCAVAHRYACGSIGSTAWYQKTYWCTHEINDERMIEWILVSMMYSWGTSEWRSDSCSCLWIPTSSMITGSSVSQLMSCERSRARERLMSLYMFSASDGSPTYASQDQDILHVVRQIFPIVFVLEYQSQHN